jgi:hypothetical protein
MSHPFNLESPHSSRCLRIVTTPYGPNLVVRVVLPVGITTTDRPIIAWRGPAGTKFEVVVTRGESRWLGKVWESGIVEAANQSVQAGPLPRWEILCAHVRVGNEDGWGDWSSSLAPAPFMVEMIEPATGVLWLFDLGYTRSMPPWQAFEHAHFAAALQGLANRTQPRLYVNFIQHDNDTVEKLPRGGPTIDDVWFRRLHEEPGWLWKMDVRRADSLDVLAKVLKSCYDGVVVWDPNVPSTAIAASTAAGALNLLPVPKRTERDSLYQRLVASNKLKERLDLCGKFKGDAGNIWGTNRKSSGSAKCDAHLWAAETFLKTGKCNAALMGYYLDAWWIKNPEAGGNRQNHTLTNHDYFIANRAFFWDLNVWADETPVDDRSQRNGQDRETLIEILQMAVEKNAGRGMIHVGGFTPWAFKYVKHGAAGGTHEPVETEWETARLLSQHGAYIDADALSLCAMANASLLQHFPLPRRYVQIPPPLRGESVDAGRIIVDGGVAPGTYLLHYVGDYDSAAWLWQALGMLWDEKERGETSMAWAVNPNLALRAAPFFEYAYRTRTANDWFMAGDSGAGYVNPSALPSSEIWQRHCARWYERFGVTFTGFLINGLSGKLSEDDIAPYVPFSQDGVVNQNGLEPRPLYLAEDRMPSFIMECDLSGDVDTDVAEIHKRAASAHGIEGNKQSALTKPVFLVFRTVLKRCLYYKQINERIQQERPDLKYKICGPSEFGHLARAALGKPSVGIYSCVLDRVRPSVDTKLIVDVLLRNDGTDHWAPDGKWEVNAGWVLRSRRAPGLMPDLKTVPKNITSVQLKRGVGPGGIAHIEIVLPTARMSDDAELALGLFVSGQPLNPANALPVTISLSARKTTIF